MIANNSLIGFSAGQPGASRGSLPLYHGDTVNHCPGCGRTHWNIGRATAECAFCDTALPLAASMSRPNKPMFWFRGSSTAMSVAV